MICPHCSKGIHYEEQDSYVWVGENHSEGKIRSEMSYGQCPLCGDLIVILTKGFVKSGVMTELFSEKIIYPQIIGRVIQTEVPERYRYVLFERRAARSTPRRGRPGRGRG